MLTDLGMLKSVEKEPRPFFGLAQESIKIVI